MKRFIAVITSAISLLLIATAFVIAGQTEKVKLKDGKTYQVPMDGNKPIRYEDDHIKMDDLSIFAQVDLKEQELLLFFWRLKAHVLTEGVTTVTITTPLDAHAIATFHVAGPRHLDERFFPKVDYPRIWDGIESPGDHWFPFRFEFDGKERFEFIQWAKIDSQTLTKMRTMVGKWISRTSERGLTKGSERDK